MSPQQQRKQALKTTTFLAGLLGSIDKDRKSSNSPSSTSQPTAAQMASRATPSSSRSPEISTRCAPTNNDFPSAPLPRAASTPSQGRQEDPRPSEPSTSLGYGSSPGERPSSRPGTGLSSNRPYRPASDSHRTGSGSRSPRDSHRRRDFGRARGGDSDRPGSSINSTPPSRERHVASPPVTQKDTTATKPSAAAGTPGAQAQRVTMHTPHPGAIRPVEDIIADLLKPHPKLVTQAQARAEAEKVTEPQLRKADVYRPSQRTHRRPNRTHHRQEYLSWSSSQLLREIDLRALRTAGKGLVDILMFNDNKFWEIGEEFEALGVHELLEEAEINHVYVDFGKHWTQRELLTEIADKMSQHAVNDLPRAKTAARKFAQAQATRTLKVSPRDNSRSKVTKHGHGVKDRATLRKTAEAFAEELFEADAAKHIPKAGTKKEVSQSTSKKTRDIAAKKATSKTIAKKVDQKSEKDDKGKSVTTLSDKKPRNRRDSKQNSLGSSPDVQWKGAPVIKKRSLPVEKDEDPEEKRSNSPQPKRMRTATDARDIPPPENRDGDHEEGKIDELPLSNELEDDGHANKRQATPERKKLAATRAAQSKKACSMSLAPKDIPPLFQRHLSSAASGATAMRTSIRLKRSLLWKLRKERDASLLNPAREPRRMIRASRTTARSRRPS